jgi:hypothetical protein
VDARDPDEKPPRYFVTGLLWGFFLGIFALQKAPSRQGRQSYLNGCALGSFLCCCVVLWTFILLVVLLWREPDANE